MCRVGGCVWWRETHLAVEAGEGRHPFVGGRGRAEARKRPAGVRHAVEQQLHAGRRAAEERRDGGDGRATLVPARTGVVEKDGDGEVGVPTQRQLDGFHDALLRPPNPQVQRREGDVRPRVPNLLHDGGVEVGRGREDADAGGGRGDEVSTSHW